MEPGLNRKLETLSRNTRTKRSANPTQALLVFQAVPTKNSGPMGLTQVFRALHLQQPTHRTLELEPQTAIDV
jgi:hypothetical protein